MIKKYLRSFLLISLAFLLSSCGFDSSPNSNLDPSSPDYWVRVDKLLESCLTCNQISCSKLINMATADPESWPMKRIESLPGESHYLGCQVKSFPISNSQPSYPPLSEEEDRLWRLDAYYDCFDYASKLECDKILKD